MTEPEIIPPARSHRTESAVHAAKDVFSIPDSVLTPAAIQERALAVMPPPPEGALTAASARPAFLAALVSRVPVLETLLAPVIPDGSRKPLAERTTDELVQLIDSGRFLAEIARIWGVNASWLREWIAADTIRSARARLARKQQAELWDWVALQVLMHAESDKVEMTRAKELASHCRWRSEKFDPDSYGEKITVKQDDDRDGRELTTAELQIIARGGTLPGGLS